LTTEQTSTLGVLVSGLLITAYAVLPDSLVNLLGAVPLVVYLGILAAAIQVIAYVLYIRDDQIDPNPTTWFMFAYGTGLLALMEWDTNASMEELMLPTICALCSIYVSLRCWVRARKADPTRLWPKGWWPDDYWERVSFILDIIITVTYGAAYVLAESSILTKEQQYWAILISLFLSNISTFIQFYPLIHETYLHPERENWKPWFIWALAYGTLAVVTYMKQGAIWHHLMFYPLSSCFLHLLMAYMAHPCRKMK
jgi:hypothetical protein